MSGGREEENESYLTHSRLEKCLGKTSQGRKDKNTVQQEIGLLNNHFRDDKAQNGKSTVLNPSKIDNRLARSRQGKIQSANQNSPISHSDNNRDKRYMYCIHKCRTDMLVARVPAVAVEMAFSFLVQQHRTRYPSTTTWRIQYCKKELYKTPTAF